MGCTGKYVGSIYQSNKNGTEIENHGGMVMEQFLDEYIGDK